MSLVRYTFDCAKAAADATSIQATKVNVFFISVKISFDVAKVRISEENGP
jgi:hypothetical protein